MKPHVRLMALTLLAMVLATPVCAQDIAGRWNGRMEPTNLSAEIRLNLERVKTSWKAEMMFRAGPDSSSLPIETLRVTSSIWPALLGAQ